MPRYHPTFFVLINFDLTETPIFACPQNPIFFRSAYFSFFVLTKNFWPKKYEKGPRPPPSLKKYEVTKYGNGRLRNRKIFSFGIKNKICYLDDLLAIFKTYCWEDEKHSSSKSFNYLCLFQKKNYQSNWPFKARASKHYSENVIIKHSHFVLYI